MLGRLLVGFLKGALLGAALGFAVDKLGLHELVGGGVSGFLTYAAIGFVIGLLVGRPIWSHLMDKSSTMVTSVLKGVFGALLAVGLFALFRRLAVDVELTLMDQTRHVSEWQMVFGAGLGALLGMWFEADDPPAPRKPKQLTPG